MTVVALLDRAATVQQSLSRDVSSLSLFGGLECANVYLGVIVRYACSKSSAIFENAKNACRFVAYLCFSLVLNVLRLRYLTQVYKTIVRSIAVYMVNLPVWKFSCHIQPSESVAFIGFSVNRSYPIFFIGKAARYFSLFYASLFQSSNKNTSIWVVIKNFFKSVLCNHSTTLTHFERS